MELSCILIDDEVQAINALKQSLEILSAHITVVDTARTIDEAIQKIKIHQPDVIFLDIRLRSGSGFEVLKRIKGNMPQVVFTSAVSDYALKAFEYDGVDYLLKPIDDDALKRSVQKVIRRKQVDRVENKGLKLTDGMKRISIASGEGITLYRLKEIVYIQADRNYSQIHFESGLAVLSSKTLKVYHELLETSGFFRVHHSFLVNISHITSYINKDGGYIELTHKIKVPVSNRNKAKVIEYLMSYKNLDTQRPT